MSLSQLRVSDGGCGGSATSLWVPVITVVSDGLLPSPLRSCLKTSPVSRIAACPLILGDDNMINNDNSRSRDDGWMDLGNLFFTTAL